MVFKSPHCIFTCQLIILELPYDGTRVIFLVVNEGANLHYILDIIFKKANVTAPMHLLAIYIRRASVLSQLPRNLLVAPSPGKRGSGELHGSDLNLLLHRCLKGTQQRLLSALLLQF